MGNCHARCEPGESGENCKASSDRYLSVLNNGAGEKAQKEENKKAQDRPAAKPSLKARLAEKKAQVAGQGKEQEENNKNKQREM